MNSTFVFSSVLDQPEILPVSHLNEYRRGVEGFGEMIGQSRTWRQIVEKIKIVAPTDATVLIVGEIDAEFRRRERENLFIVLHKTGWKIKGADGAAELLGIKPTTLISRIERQRLTAAARKISVVSVNCNRAQRDDSLPS